ncbi:MAG: FAD-binding and (Fe-S)-binding domain-containing protein [Microscillaceae bacterium]
MPLASDFYISLPWQELTASFAGEFYTDFTTRTLYATDASAYRELPLAVALPKTEDDLKALIAFARNQQTSLIPRTAGTSLAGQVVGNGIVVDMSKYFTQILELNAQEGWVKVQPGVVRDELNLYLKPYGLYFGPETSTANRAMIGGMVGNNSCGSNSVIYGSTREHLLEVKAILSDGSEVIFENINKYTFAQKCQSEGLEGKIYQTIQSLLSQKENQEEIRREFPKPNIPRRNTGYALDLLLETAPFTEGKEDFNFCKLIAGSEGTLCMMTEIKLQVLPLPPPEKVLVCGHFESIDASLRANLIALKYHPSACELMDHYVLERTKTNREQSQNRFFVKCDPKAILVVEISRESKAECEADAQALIQELEKAGLGYHFPIVAKEDAGKVWNLRKAGLGLLSNIPGDEKPAPVIEDTAVDVQELPEYIADFNAILAKHGMYSVHYAHAGSGELHLRPILNLKTAEGQAQFRLIAEEIADLVKKYKGSLSGEHGDGRLRAEFIPKMVGEKNYALLKEVKKAFDPENIFNPGKIVDAAPMDTFLRYEKGQATPEFKTYFDFTEDQGILRAAEKCNGSGDCRKTHLSGGTMCPSYMATRAEKDSTRARANILREVLTHSTGSNPFASEAIKDVMDLCLSCKGCKAECPSNVDVGKMKAEFLQNYYDSKGIPLRTRMIAHYNNLNKLASLLPQVYNFWFGTKLTGELSKKLMGFHPKRSLPELHKQTLRKWANKHLHRLNQAITQKKGQVFFFADEFTNYNDTPIGIKAIELLTRLGYEVILPNHAESGRTYLSKGLLKDAKKIAEQNVRLFSTLVQADKPLVGLEPSAILTFRDEYIDLAEANWRPKAEALAKHTFTIEEFLAQEVDKGNITAAQFTTEKRLIKLHGHCHQKALSSLVPTKKILSLPQNYEMHLIPSGCCGMAGSFGYEAEHYEISMQIGELVLFPTVRNQAEEVIIAAPGTSCRHQIKDGTQRLALHPVEVLWGALR